MKIGLIDVDGRKFPNLALMKISAWHKQRGDSVEWYEPLFSGHMDRVYMSKVFSFSADYEYYVDADEVIKGGSGYCISTLNGKERYDTEKDNPLPYEIEHFFPDYELYGIKNTAYGYLTRGCPRNCAFCHTSQKDGLKSAKVADLNEFWNGQGKIVLLDQNILACKEWSGLFDQLIESKAAIEFNGGLDIRLITEQAIEKIKQMRLQCIHFAFDRYQDKDTVMRKLKLVKDLTGYGRHKILVYVLVNYDTTIKQDLERIEYCRSLAFSPFVMIYDKAHCSPVYRKMQRWCNNYFVFYRTPRFEDYEQLTRSERELIASG